MAAGQTVTVSEHNEQVLVMKWADHPLQRSRFPELVLLHAIPNFARMPSPWYGAWAKAEGKKAGVPDLCLPVARGGYAGLYLEMKTYQIRLNKTKAPTRTPTKLTEEQEWWHGMLRQQGYFVVTCWTAADAQASLESYLNLLPTPNLIRS